jgi:steroid 5-alpha reductase family enzyme
MIFPELTWVLLLVAAALCAIGFYKFVYFMSVGYGLAVGGIGAAIFIIALIRGNLTPVMAVLCLLLLVYGIRLGGFLLVREIKSAAYRKTLNAQTGKPVPIFVKIFMWIFMAVLYVMETSAIWYREAAAPDGPQLTAWIGALIMLCGILLEALADRQKSAAKKIDPNRPAMDGLYKFSRCPNYFGEITFWTGVFISGWGVLKGGQWIVAILGYLMILGIMISGAQRLEKRQNKNYGHMPEYRAYVEKTPILVPFIPVYHLVKEK